MTRSLYLTARCTLGCELWGTPTTIAQHVRERRCRGLAWFRRPIDTVLIEPGYLRILERTTASHLVTPYRKTEGADPKARWRIPFDVWAGGQLRSPVPGVPARVWWLAVKPYLDAGVPADEVLDLAIEPRSFNDLMPEDHLEQFTICPVCGETVAKLAAHQRTSSRCRNAAAANRVLELWNLGHRDPWTATDKPPLTWADLQLVRWKRRVTLVEYPKHNAVLIAPVAVS
ncbi:MAG: hypothetical protein AB7N61_07205 [Acidimicrobiia bacterium]